MIKRILLKVFKKKTNVELYVIWYNHVVLKIKKNLQRYVHFFKYNMLMWGFELMTF